MFTNVNRSLISAFVERWHPETNSFHMPFGEMTVTLHDVALILGLPVVDRTRMVTATMSRSVLIHSIELELQMSATDLRSNMVHGGIRLIRLQEHCATHLFEDQVEAQCFLLYVLGCTLFVDKSASSVNAHIMESLLEPGIISEYAWGAASLAYLYRQLGLASRADTSQIAGCLPLLEVYIIFKLRQLILILNNCEYLKV